MSSAHEYRLVIDQSTSGTKLLLFEISENITLKHRIDREHRQIYPKEGWVEHNPMEIINNVYSLFEEYQNSSLVPLSKISGISITNQRETVMMWDKSTGIPIYNAIVWQCNRTNDLCSELIAKSYNSLVSEKTGLRIDSYFSGAKISWLMNNCPSARELADMGNLAIGTIDTWLVWNLTEGDVYATEPSNASRTLLYNIFDNKWDQELCDLFNAPLNLLPEVRSSKGDFGSYRGIPIVSVMADSQAALFGQGCSKLGMVKATLGTGCSVMMQMEQAISKADDKILTTIAWGADSKYYYGLEGIIRSFGDTMNWAKDSLQLFTDFEEATQTAFSVEDSGGVVFIPAQCGLGAPFWNGDVQAAFIGMHKKTTRAHLLRALFESQVYQIKAVMDEMERVSNCKVETLRVDGGSTKNNKLMQLLADTLQKEVMISDIEELSGVGCMLVGESEHKIKHVLNPVGIRDDSAYAKWYSSVVNML